MRLFSNITFRQDNKWDRNTYVGPVPLTAVAIATKRSSSTSISCPSARSSELA